MTNLDLKLFYLINRDSANVIFDVIMPAITARGYLLVLPYVFYVLYKGCLFSSKKSRPYLTSAIWIVLIAICAIPLAEWVGHLVKNYVARVRPCHVLDGVRLLVSCPHSLSMPSGHAVSSFAVSLPLFYLTRSFISLPWRLYPLFLAVAIAFSRVYVGVHYPSDVIVGAVLGSAWSGVLCIVYSVAYGNRMERPYEEI
jgi:undecaprenyl-diphosphatase